MLVHRFYQPQNFFKKSQKKLNFLPKNGKICVKKCLFFKKFSKIFLLCTAFFFLTFLPLSAKKQKMRSAFAERTRNYLLFFVSEVVDMRTQVLAFLCFGRQNGLNNDSILQTFLLQTTAILIRFGNIAVN